MKRRQFNIRLDDKVKKDLELTSVVLGEDQSRIARVAIMGYIEMQAQINPELRRCLNSSDVTNGSEED